MHTQTIAITVHGTSYTASLTADATIVHRADGSLLGAVTTCADVEVLDACMPASVARALDVARRMVAAESAEAEAAGLAELRRIEGRRVAEAHWRMVALLWAVRVDALRAELEEIAG